MTGMARTMGTTLTGAQKLLKIKLSDIQILEHLFWAPCKH